MEYSKWALARVDELERRVAETLGAQNQSYADSFEWRSGNENAYISGKTKTVIDFPSFVAAESVSVFASLQARFMFNSTYEFSFFVDGACVKSQTISSNAEKIEFFAIKRVVGEPDQSHTSSIQIESSGETLELVIENYSLNVVGKCKQSQQLATYGKLSADIFGTEEDLSQQPSEIQHHTAQIGESATIVAAGNSVFQSGADFVCYSALAGEVPTNTSGTYATEMAAFLQNPTEVILPSLNFENPAEDSVQEANFLSENEKLAIGYVIGNNIHLAESVGPKSEQQIDTIGTKIARGKRVAVAYSKHGELFVCRETLDGKLYVAAASAMSFETYVEKDVTDFDIVRAPDGSAYKLAVLYIKNGELFAKFLSDSGLGAAQQITCRYGAKTVRAVRASKRLLLFVSGGKNQIIAASVPACTNQKNYNCAISILSY